MSVLGKKFEQQFKKDWLRLPYSDCERLTDPGFGNKGVSNISDFICYCYPTLFYLECKTIKEWRFPLDNLTQYDDLVEKIGKKGIRAGVIIWFYEMDRVIFAPIEQIKKMKEDKKKSINLKKEDDKVYNLIEVPSVKKRTFMTSDYTCILPKGE